MLKKHLLLTGLLLLIIIITSCSKQESANNEIASGQQELFVSAAASLTDAMKEIASAFEEEHPEVKITANFAGSGNLARQIQQGAPVDVFLSADETWMNRLMEEGFLLPDTETVFAANELVLITQKGTGLPVSSLEDLTAPEADKIAIGNPDSVPAGMYAKEALEHTGIWDELQERMVYGKDVRQVLTYVETGNTQAGFVYNSDTIRADDVEIIFSVDQSLTEPVVYPAAVAESSVNKETAKDFTAFLQTDKVQGILRKYGFKGI